MSANAQPCIPENAYHLCQLTEKLEECSNKVQLFLNAALVEKTQDTQAKRKKCELFSLGNVQKKCNAEDCITSTRYDTSASQGTRDDLSLCSLPLSISECSNATNHRLSAQNVADPVWCVVENTAPESRSSDYTSCSSESSCCLDTLQADIYSPAARSKLRFSFSSSASEDFVRTNVVDTTDVNQKISCFKTEPAWNDIDRHFNSPSRVYNVVDLNHIPTTVTSIFPVLTGQLFRQRKSLTEASRGILIDSKKNRRLRADPVQRFKQYQMLWQYDKYGDSSISSST